MANAMAKHQSNRLPCSRASLGSSIICAVETGNVSSRPKRQRRVARQLRPRCASSFSQYGKGFAAHRRYHQLRSQGVPHDTAIRQAMNVPQVQQEEPQGGDPLDHPKQKEQHK
jgi:hypothetical protein